MERIRWWAGVSVFAVALYVVAFEVPFLFPPTEYLVSPSYAFGFNNAVAVLAIAGVLGAAALAYLVLGESRGPLVRYPTPTAPDNAEAPRPLPSWLFGLLALAYTLLTSLGYWYTQGSASAWLTWEVRPFVHRMRLMEYFSLRPYVDFSSEYGLLLAYAPNLVLRVLAPLGVSDIGAYFVTHLLLNLAGLACLFYLATHAAGAVWRRGLVLALVGLAGFAPYMGLNGVTLRYVFPLASVLFGHRLWMWLEPRPPGWRLAITAAGVALLAGANVAVSPEIGVAFTLGWLAYSLLELRRDGRLLVTSIVALGVAVLGARLVLPEAYYDSLLRFGAGANNLPLVPAAHIVLYLLTLALLVPPAVAAGLRGGTRDAPLLGALAGTAVLLMPGALGRADPPHVLLYGLGPSLLLLLALANARSASPLACFATGYVVVSIALFNLVNLINFFGLPVRQLALDPIGVTRSFLRARRAELAPRDLSFLPELDKYPGIGVPFATYGSDHAVDAYLFRKRLLGPEYFVGAVGVYTPEELARKLADVSRFEHLLVRRVSQRLRTPDRDAELLHSLRRWYLYPVCLKPVRDDLDTNGEIVRFIAAHYEPIERVGPLVVMRRRGPSFPPHQPADAQ